MEALVRPHLKLTRPRAERITRAEVPWLSTVRLPWGTELLVLNISRTGILFETSAKFAPGGITQFELCGGDDKVIVPGRFVRSEVAAVDGRGVKYHAAAVFEREVDLEAPFCATEPVSSTPQHLADWLLQLSVSLVRSREPGALRQGIERGLRELVTARDIQIREAPIAPHDGCESIYFKVAVGNGSELVLQVMFEPGKMLSDVDFKLLQAGSALAAVVLRFDGTVSSRLVTP